MPVHSLLLTLDFSVSLCTDSLEVAESRCVFSARVVQTHTSATQRYMHYMNPHILYASGHKDTLASSLITALQVDHRGVTQL